MRAARWFRIGSYGLVVAAILHFVSNRRGLPIHVDDADGRELLRLMAQYEIDFFGLHRTLDQTLNGFIVTWGVMLLVVATINLLVARLHPGDAPPAGIRWANLVAWMLCLVAVSLFWSWPQIALFAVLSACFALSVLPGRSPAHDRPGPGKKKDPRIAIIGAGAAGLTAAWALKKRGYRHVTVFEKLDRVGGKCFTIESEDHAIDLAAHEMLAGYTDVMQLARELGVKSHGWQEVVVYDRTRRKYLDIMGASTAGGYSKLQVAWASIRYTWMLLTRYRRFARPGTGLAEAPPELLQPVGTWLKAMRLEALEEIVLFVMKVQGYGRLDEAAAIYFVKFQGLRNWVSNVLHNIGIVHYWPRVFTNGFQDLWNRVAERLDVRLNSHVGSIRRTCTADSEVIGVEVTVQDREPEHFDRLILTCPHDVATLKTLGLDMDKDEKTIFSKVQTHTFVTTACRVEGIPTGVVGTIPLPAQLDYTGYIKVYADCDITVFFTLAPTPDPNLQQIYDRIVETVAGLPQSGTGPPRVVGMVDQQVWAYHPHPGLTDLAGGYFLKLQALQGHRQTYYAGALLEMETVGNTVANAKHLVETQFPSLK